MSYFKRIEKITAEILKELKISGLPIPIEKVIAMRGLEIKPYDFGDDVSGVLVIQSNVGWIGVNPKESKVRRRFTMAHELGHYELHKDEQKLFIDKEFTVAFRSQNPTPDKVKFEQEANAFAACLLMPEELVVNEIQKYHFNLNNDDSVKKLAKLFDVSVAAMSVRLANLDIFRKSFI